MLASDGWRRHGARLVFGLLISASLVSVAVATLPSLISDAAGSSAVGAGGVAVHDVVDDWYDLLVLRTVVVVDVNDVLRLIDSVSSVVCWTGVSIGSGWTTGCCFLGSGSTFFTSGCGSGCFFTGSTTGLRTSLDGAARLDGIGDDTDKPIFFLTVRM